MAFSKLDQLYRQVVMDHAQHPRHFGLSNEQDVTKLHNPTCGDVILLQVQVDEQDVIADIFFVGDGCTISRASASMMSELVVGKTRQQALELCESFSRLVQGETVQEDSLGDVALLKSVAKFPARIKCATLAWQALEKSLQRQQNQ